MRFSNLRKPSPAIVISVIALVFAMVGSAVAGTDGLTGKLTKSSVKKIAKKQIKKAAPTLSVAHAATADSATEATHSANAASPDVYAHVTVSGTAPTVDANRSKGLAAGDFTDTGTAGVYCVTLPAYKTLAAHVDQALSGFTGGLDVLVVPDDVNTCTTAGFAGNTIIVVADDTGAPTADAFDIQLFQ